jgi:hypothetical protein
MIVQSLQFFSRTGVLANTRFKKGEVCIEWLVEGCLEAGKNGNGEGCGINSYLLKTTFPLMYSQRITY